MSQMVVHIIEPLYAAISAWREHTESIDTAPMRRLAPLAVLRLRLV
jgi:hypothetical protein